MTKTIVVTMLAAMSLHAETLVARIGFPFEVAGVKMPAGNYKLSPVSATQNWIANESTGQKVLLMGFAPGANRSVGPVQPLLGFACVAGRCVLSQVRMEYREFANQKVRKQLDAGPEAVQVTTVALVR